MIRHADRANHRLCSAATTGRGRATRRIRPRSSFTTASTRRCTASAWRGRTRRTKAAVALRAPAVLRRALPLLRLQRRDHDAPRRRAASTSSYLEARSTCSPRRCRDRRARVADALGRRHADLSLRGQPRSHLPAHPRAIHVHARCRDRHRSRSARRPRSSSSRRCAQLGFNRLSLGVQDFAPEVQQAINRVQSYEQTRDDHRRTAARSASRSINVDLIYGLP